MAVDTTRTKKAHDHPRERRPLWACDFMLQNYPPQGKLPSGGIGPLFRGHFSGFHRSEAGSSREIPRTTGHGGCMIVYPNAGLRPQPTTGTKYQISNKEYRITKCSLPFGIGYSIFCGSLFNFFASCREVTDKGSNTNTSAFNLSGLNSPPLAARSANPTSN
jgi:hypothetical protein